jgi:hypothetical protein
MKAFEVACRRLPVFASCLVLISSAAHAGLQDDLNARWRGAWLIVTSGIYSNCNGLSTDNRISGDLMSGNGRFAFEPGELARVTKVDAKRHRIDVTAALEEDVLIDYQDGPFTLYREAPCTVELLFDFGDERTKDLEVAAIESQFAQWFERYARLEDAEQSANWNRRERKDYPEGYEDTLAAYKAWKIEQHNLLVENRIADSAEQMPLLLAQVSSGSEFGAGLSYGIAAMREAMSDDCDSLLASRPETFSKPYEAPNPDRANGYKTGQALAYHIELSRRLKGCFIDAGDAYARVD